MKKIFISLLISLILSLFLFTASVPAKAYQAVFVDQVLYCETGCENGEGFIGMFNDGDSAILRKEFAPNTSNWGIWRTNYPGRQVAAFIMRIDEEAYEPLITVTFRFEGEPVGTYELDLPSDGYWHAIYLWFPTDFRFDTLIIHNWYTQDEFGNATGGDLYLERMRSSNW